MDTSQQDSSRILVAIEDDHLRRLAETCLWDADFTVSAPTDAEATSILTHSFRPDIIVIDLAMAASDGTPLYQRTSVASEHYVLCIDTNGSGRNRVESLRHGADDVISVPFECEELVARCEALLRRPRATGPTDEPSNTNVISLGPLVVDTGRHEIRLNDTEVAATRIEFQLLEYLSCKPTEVASREDLLKSVWGPHWVGDNHVVDVHLSNLRRKLDEAMPSMPIVHTVRGVGFRISNEVLDAVEADAKANPRPTAPLFDDIAV